MKPFRRHQSAGEEDSLLQRAATRPEYPTLESLTGESLRQITKSEGVDFATALLFDRLGKSKHHADFIQRIDALRLSPASSPLGMDTKVVIVPGALYIERPELGGDGRLVREVAGALGLKTELIPAASLGSVTTNAGLICDWLRTHSGERLILVSLSKGGADLKLALSAPDAPELFRNVSAWINVCGPLNGSLMADWITESRVRAGFFRLKFWWQGRDFKFVTSLRHDDGAPLHFDLRPPATMKMLSLIGFPLHRHMTTRFSRFCHRIIGRHGPNDGTMLLADLQEMPGEIYPAWGMDHYFQPASEAASLVAATLQYLAEEE